MKLKYKLAEECIGKFPYLGDEEAILLHFRAYRQGFEKARELLCEKLYRDQIYPGDRDYIILNYLNTGEEEVNDDTSKNDPSPHEFNGS